MTADDGDVRTTAELKDAAAAGLRSMTYARIAIELVLLGAMVVLARLLTPAEFGMYAVVAIVQELSISIPMEGIGSALVQRRGIERAHLQAGLMMSLIVGLVLTVVTLALAVTLVVDIYGHATSHLVMLATPWYLVCAVYAIPAAVLRRRLDFGRLARLDLVNSTVRAGGSIVFAAAGLGAGSLVLGSLTSSVACLVLALTFVRVPWPRWNAAAVRDLLPYGGPAALACVAWTGFRNGDYAVVGARLGAAQAGFYWRGYQLAVEYQKKISVLMTQMAFPVLARTAGADEMFELRRRIVQLATVALFPMLVLLALLAPAVVPWLFGPAWEPAVVPCQILAAGGAATLVIDAVGSSLMAEGRSRALLGFGVAHFVVYIGAVVAVAGHGLAAVAVTAVVVHTLFVGVAYELLFRHHARPSLVLLWEDVRAACVASLALAVAALPLDWALRHAGAPVPIELLAVLPVATVAYLAALYAWFPAAWNDLAVSIGRVAPGFVTTRLPGPAGRRRALEPASAPE